MISYSYKIFKRYRDAGKIKKMRKVRFLFVCDPAGAGFFYIKGGELKNDDHKKRIGIFKRRIYK